MGVITPSAVPIWCYYCICIVEADIMPSEPQPEPQRVKMPCKVGADVRAVNHTTQGEIMRGRYVCGVEAHIKRLVGV